MIKTIKTVGYSRVSTKKQDVEKYTHYFTLYEKRTGDKIDDIQLEKVSATKTALKDRLLWSLLQDKDISTIVVPNASRCLRSVPDAVDLVRFLRIEREDISIVIEERRLILNAAMSVEDENYFYDLVITASRETFQRSEAVKLGLAKRREAGLPPGANRKRKLDSHKNRVFQLLSQGMSKAFICRSLSVDPATLYRFLKKEEKEILGEFGYSQEEYSYDFKTGSINKKGHNGK